MSANFTIISNNCWGAEVYKELNIPYNTPFVGLFIPPECYINLLENFENIIYTKLDFTDTSKYDYYNNFRRTNNYNYPIGILKPNIEIHFLHYVSKEEAEEKWKRRIKRFMLETNRFFKFCDREVFDNVGLINRFNELNFQNKVCFTTKKYPDYNSVVTITEQHLNKEVVDGKSLYPISKHYFDAIKWIERGNGQLKFLKKMLLKFRILKTNFKSYKI